jgi:methionyl-tRNA formyltransferase
MRVLFFGTPEFAVPSLAALIGAHEVAAVVTRPDRPRGRGHKVTASPVKATADAHDIPVLQPTRLGDAQWLQDIADLRADIAVVAAYGRLLPQALLDVPHLGFINVHASLLPRWRGAAPIHRAVLAGDTVTGVTIMRVVLELDAGPILASKSIPIGPNDTSETLDASLGAMGADLLIATLARMEAGPILEVPQDDSKATYAPKLERHESRIDWARPAAEIGRQIRGLQPWPLAAGLIDGRRVAFLRATVSDAPAPGEPGTIVEAGAAGLVVACSTGAVRITHVLPEGRRAMSVQDFLNGVRVGVGTQIMPVPVPGANS